MRRTLFPAIGAACALLYAVGIAEAQEPPIESLAPNPSVEEGEGDEPEGWTFYAWDRETSRGWWDGEHARTGSRSLGMQGRDCGWSTVVAVEPGSLCSLVLHYRAEGGPSRAIVYVRYPARVREPQVLLYLPIPTIAHDNRAEFIDGVWVGGADERGFVRADAGHFIPPEGVTEVSLLIKLVSEEPTARLWLDDIIVTASEQRQVQDRARLLHPFEGGALWTDSENNKILPESDPPTESADAVTVSAARGEYESFQLAVRPDADMSQVDFVWTALTGPAVIPADALLCRRIEYVDIDRPRGPFGHRGLNPDPLTDRLPVDVSAGLNQGFWFTLQVPRDSPAGDYRGELTLRADAQELVSVPLHLRVYDFELPRRPSIDVRSNVRYSLLLPRESGDRDQVLLRYYENVFAHGSRCAPAPRVDRVVDGDRVEVDATEHIEHLTFMRDELGSMGITVPALWIAHAGDHQMPPDASWEQIPIFASEDLTELNPDFVATFTAYLTELVAQLRAAGVFTKPEVRFIDEPHLSHEETRIGIRAVSELLLEIEPELLIAHTVSAPHPDLFDVTARWILHTDNWERALPQIERARDAGAEILVYNNAVNYPDHRPIRMRLWPWLLRKYEVDGTYSWWGTVCWRGRMEDPWTAGAGSSGVLLYPPRTPDEAGPIDSIRWELFREGLEDFEYMKLAEELAARLEAAGDAEMARIGRDAVSNALDLVERWPNVRAANDEPYTLDLAVVAAARERLAEAIVTMKEAL